MNNQWVYLQSEPGLFTVGFYDPAGAWHSDSDHDNRGEAADRVAYLNGNPIHGLSDPTDVGRASEGA